MMDGPRFLMGGIVVGCVLFRFEIVQNCMCRYGTRLVCRLEAESFTIVAFTVYLGVPV